MARSISEYDARPEERKGLAAARLSPVRTVGIALLAICALAAFRLHGLVIQLPRHQPSVAEMLMSLVFVLTGVAGAMAAVNGPDLFRPSPWPPRPDARVDPDR